MKLKSIMAFIITAVMAFSLCGCAEIQKFIDEDLSGSENSLTESNTSSNSGKLVSHYIDVGQGDSEFIELPDGTTMLIDAGTADYGETVVDYIKDLGYKKIDYLIGTHPHADHIGGMQKVVKSFDIGSVYMPKASTNTKTYENLLTEIKNKGLKIKTAKAGVSIISENDLKVDILAPNSSKYDELNNYSAVVKITYKNNKFLYTGDAEKLSEDEIKADVSADVIKVGHHGSTSSSSKNFVKNVSPKYAVICVGKDNTYGHPKDSIIKRWENIGANVLRTDEDGSITITSDGKNISVNTEK
ncbi:MAG: ComEC/Rec2 family competence protein [Acutalibacteraceae bacterium]